jgi:hypothetical protein
MTNKNETLILPSLRETLNCVGNAIEGKERLGATEKLSPLLTDFSPTASGTYHQPPRFDHTGNTSVTRLSRTNCELVSSLFCPSEGRLLQSREGLTRLPPTAFLSWQGSASRDFRWRSSHLLQSLVLPTSFGLLPKHLSSSSSSSSSSSTNSLFSLGTSPSLSPSFLSFPLPRLLGGLHPL